MLQRENISRRLYSSSGNHEMACRDLCMLMRSEMISGGVLDKRDSRQEGCKRRICKVNIGQGLAFLTTSLVRLM